MGSYALDTSVANDSQGPHVWACHVRDYDFVYLYGTSAERDRISQREPGCVLHKGTAPSLDEAHRLAAKAAEVTGRFYADVGTVRVMSMMAFERLLKHGTTPPQGGASGAASTSDAASASARLSFAALRARSR